MNPGIRLALAACVTLGMSAAPAGTRELKGQVPIVESCVDKDGNLLSAAIVRSSGFPDVDAAALKIARHTKYSANNQPDGKPLEKSCIRFKVKIVLDEGKQPAK